MVVQYGIGEIGREITRVLQKKKGFEIVGAIDIDPEKIGRDLGSVAGAGNLGVKIVSDKDGPRLLKKADVVIHSTSSRLQEVLPQISTAARAGADIISTCEELSYPFRTNKRFATRIDRLARRNGVTILGCGVNPGFVMDALVITVSGACQELDEIHVKRVVDASRRRVPLQKKVGAGLSVEEFRNRVSSGKIGHVGLRESAWMIADGVGWNLDRVDETIDPAVAQKPISMGHIKVAAGQVAGLRQSAIGSISGKDVLTLELDMYMGAQPESDSIVIKGVPPLNLVFNGGIQGDRATAAIAVNMIPRITKAAAGLTTMKDLPPPAAIL